MNEFFFRTEDIKLEHIQDFFVETAQDREVINALKNRNPMILIGSRGVGKSFLLKITQKELLDNFEKDRIFPVYISFIKSSLLQTNDKFQFMNWMLAKICTSILTSLSKYGIFTKAPQENLLQGQNGSLFTKKEDIEHLIEQYEESWKMPNSNIDSRYKIESLDVLKESIESLAGSLGIERFALLIDEAAHIFLPEQQRQFFTLFRDLRSPYITCNAAVYPGVTSYGETFQPVHDATVLSIDRNILDKDYVNKMRDIIETQANSSLSKNISQHKENFAILAYAATGNPRLLLKTVARAPRMNSKEVNEVIKEFYRTEIWSEHSTLVEKYTGHQLLIDWGRNFLENNVLLTLKDRNNSTLAEEENKYSSAFFWIQRESPEAVQEAIRILTYTGIVIENASGIKAVRDEIGNRYTVNLGCLFALEAMPSDTAYKIAANLKIKRMLQFSSNSKVYESLTTGIESSLPFREINENLNNQLDKSMEVLDISQWQKEKLRELNLITIRDVLGATESELKKAAYIGQIRARQIKNTVMAAVLEYLSG